MKLLYLIIDSFLLQEFPSEILSKISIDSIFKQNNNIYSTNKIDEVIENFFNYIFPINNLDKTLDEQIQVPIDFLWDIEKEKGWYRSTLTKEPDTKKYIINSDVVYSEIQGINYKIQPEGNVIHDYEWRCNLKEGDEIDFLDNADAWYIATIINRNEDTVKVGVRRYIPDGKNIDENGRFIGWKKEFDVTCKVFDSRIQKPFTYSRPIEEYNHLTAYSVETDGFNPFQAICPQMIKDSEGNDKLCSFVIPKTNGNSDDNSFNIYYIKLCNYFFEKLNPGKIVNKTKDDYLTKLCTLENFEYFLVITDIFSHTYKNFHLIFAKQVLPIYQQLAFNVLLEFSKIEKREFKLIRIVDILTKMFNMQKIIHFEHDASIHFADFILEFGFQCFKTSTILEKRLLGLTALKTGEGYTLKCEKPEKLLFLLHNTPNIFDLIYDGKCHSEIVQKGDEIIKYLFKVKLISQEHINQLTKLLINSTDNLELSNALCKVLSYTKDLEISLIKQVVNVVINYSTVPQKETSETIITLILEAPKENFKELAEPLLDWFLNYFLSPDNNNNISNVISKVIENTFDKMFSVPWGGNVLKIFYSKYLNIIMEKFCFENIMNCITLLKTINQPGLKSQNEKNILYTIMIEQHKIFDKLIQYLQEGKYNSAIFELFSFVLENTSQQDNIINNDLIDILFKIFISSNGTLHEYKNEFIIWIKNLHNKNVLNINQIEFVFEYLKQTDLQLTAEMCDFYWDLFLEVNNLLTIQNSHENGMDNRYAGISNEGCIYPANKPSEIKKEMKNYLTVIRENPNYNPFKLKYFELIWQMLVVKPPQQYYSSSYKLFSLFYDDCINISISKDYYKEVMSRCIDILNQPETDSTSNEITDNNNNTEITKAKISALSLLDSLISFSEMKGTAFVKSYHSFTSKSVKIKIDFIDQANIKPSPNNFTLNLNSTMTVWELKTELSPKVDLSPEFISLMIYPDKEIPDSDNGLDIQYALQNSQKITINKKSNIESIPQVPLVINQQFTPKALSVFHEIYDMFKLPNELMSKEGCAGFTKVVLGVNEISPNDHHVEDLFKRYDYDNDGYVTFEGFTQFFLDAINIDNKTAIVWENIKCFGYRNDLKKSNEQLENSITKEDYELMPRYILGNNQLFFNVLFESQRSPHKIIAFRSRTLIEKISANNTILESILNQDDSFQQTLSNKENTLLFNYILELICACVDDNQKDERFIKWREEFLSGNSFINLIKEHLLEIDTNVKEAENFKSISCLLDIVISGLTKYFHYEKYRNWFYYRTQKEFENEQDKEENEKEEEIIIDEKKYFLDELILFTYNIVNSTMKLDFGISNNENKGAALDVIKQALNLFTLITIYQNGKFFIDDTFLMISKEDKENFVYTGLVNKDSMVIQCFFLLMFFCVIKGLKTRKNEQSAKFIEQLKYFLNTHLLDVEFVTDKIPQTYFSIYLFMLNERLFNANEALCIVNNIIDATINTNIFHYYFNIIDGLLNLISETDRAKICQDKDVLNVLINRYFLQNINEEFVSLESEAILYTIISKFVMSNSAMLTSFFENSKIQNINQYLSKLPDKKDNYTPNNESRSSSTYIGIQNLKYICYMISILQQFYNQTTFAKSIISARDNLPHKQSPKIDDDNLLHQLQRMFTYLQMSNRSSFNPENFVYSFKDYDGQPTDINVQCDAQEFLSMFMDKIEFSLKPTQYKYLMKNIFLGETCSQLICKNGCGSIRNRFEDLAFLSLDITNSDNLEQCLHKYSSEEIIDDFTCEKCNKKTQHIKRISLNKLPNVLVIHLQRMNLNYETFETVKVNSKLTYQLVINLKEYSTEEINKCKYTVSQNSEQYDEFSSKVYEHTDDYYVYEIKGVVVHSGTAQFGHYYSFLKTDKQQHGIWFKCNDDRVSMFFVNMLPKETYGGTIEKHTENGGVNDWEETEQSKSAYMLVYERVKKSPLFIKETNTNAEHIDTNNNIHSIDNFDKFMKDIDPFNKDKEEENKIYLDCEKTAFSRNDNNNSSEDKLYKYKDDVFKIVNYYSNYKHLPHDISEYYTEVLNDNIIFRNDKSIYNECFCVLLQSIVDKIITTEKEYTDSQIINIFTQINEIILSFLIKSSLKKEVGDIIKSLTSLLKIKPFLSKIVLNLFLKDEKKWMFNLIVTVEDNFNSSFSNYLTTAIINSFEHDDIRDLGMTALNYIYSLIPLEMSQNWTKMVSYLDIFDKLASCENKDVLNYLFEKETIAKLGDFFLGKESPLLQHNEKRIEMGTKLYNAKFAPLISAISKLGCICNNFKDKNYNEIQKQVINTQDEKKENESKSFTYSLSDNDMKILNNINFYKKAIKGYYDQTALGKLIAHYMYEDIDFTEKLYYPIIDLISNVSDKQIQEVFNLIHNILILEDSLVYERFSVLLGFPKVVFSKKTAINDKLPSITFVSTLFPNKETILSNMISKWKDNDEYIVALSYFYSLIFNGKSLMRYYAPLPNPKNISESYNELITRCAKKQIDELAKIKQEKFTTNVSRVEHAIQTYNDKLNECKQQFKETNTTTQWEITFLPKDYYLGRAVKEKLTDIPFESANMEEIYLLRSDMTVELETKKDSVQISNQNEQTNSTLKEEAQVIECPGKYDTYVSKTTYTHEKNIGDQLKFMDKRNKNYYINLYKRWKEEDEKELLSKGDIDNYIETTKENEQMGMLLKKREIIRVFKPKRTLPNEIIPKTQSTNNKAEETKEICESSEQYEKVIIEKEYEIKDDNNKKDSIDKEEEEVFTQPNGISQQEHNIEGGGEEITDNNEDLNEESQDNIASSNKKTGIIRSYFLINPNKSKSIQALLKLDCSQYEFQYPQNIMVFLNSNCSITAFSFYIENDNDIQDSCEVKELLVQECDLSKVEIINEQMEIKRCCKKSKSLEEINELKEELNGKSLSNSMHHEKETQAEFDAGVPDDVCELICGSCGTPNWIRDGDNYICNNCHLSLLE